MKSVNIIIAFLLLTSTVILGQKRNKKEDAILKWNYELKCHGIGNNGEYLVKVFSLSKTRNLDLEIAKKNAVHGIIFKGVYSEDRSCTSQPALVKDSNTEEQKREYFDIFFSDGGKYRKFVNLVANGAVDAGDRYTVKVGRKKYSKIGVVVSVNKNMLRKELEDAGVIKKLTSGF